MKDKEKEGEKVVCAQLSVELEEKKSEATQQTKRSTSLEKEGRDNGLETVRKTRRKWGKKYTL